MRLPGYFFLPFSLHVSSPFVADRIAYISDGRVREIGTHDELMANPDSKYRVLVELQDMGTTSHRPAKEKTAKKSVVKSKSTVVLDEDEEGKDKEVDKETEKKVASKARLLAKDDVGYFAVGSVGAVLAGLMFPGWGIIFAYSECPLLPLCYHRPVSLAQSCSI